MNELEDVELDARLEHIDYVRRLELWHQAEDYRYRLAASLERAGFTGPTAEADYLASVASWRNG